MATEENATEIPQLVERLQELMGRHFDELRSITSRLGGTAAFPGGNLVPTSSRVSLLKRRMLLKYFGVDAEAFTAPSYSRFMGLKSVRR